MSHAEKPTPSAARFLKVTTSMNTGQKDGKPISPTMEGFLDKPQDQQKQRLGSLAILSKK
jgi:hypothetical protein